MSILVVCIVALIGLTIPVLLTLSESAARAECQSKLKQIGAAFHTYESVHKRLPPLYGGGPQGENYTTINTSFKSPDVWGSTHVFLLPYLEMGNLYKSMATGEPPQYVPPQDEAVPTYVCPSDPSMSDGIVIGGARGGSSYAANAQVFAPLVSEGLTGTSSWCREHPARFNFCDRGSSLFRIMDGISNTIFFTHSYALCGSDAQGSAWGYTAGIGNTPSPVNTFQPWSRASYLSQTYSD